MIRKINLMILFAAVMVMLANGGVSGDESSAPELITPVPGISYTPLEQVVPGPGLPDGLNLRGANNNLDIARYQGRFYFAFRTAPTHFASRVTRLIILSSPDAKRWELEKIILKGRDMREPRFMVFKDRLFFYFFTAGKNFWTFDPQSIWASEYTGSGKWTEPREIWEPGTVVWRPKEHNGVALMSTYQGSSVYDAVNDTPSEVQLLKSDDGINWEHYDPDHPVQVYDGGEADFEFDDEGNLYTVVRNEAGATKICKGAAENIAVWECKESRFKYDSPIVFKHGGVIYMIARRNLGGEFQRKSILLPKKYEPLYSLARYWFTRKRTAMYRYNIERMEVEWLFDFPSRGDTSFPAMVKLDDNRYLLYNYSSPIDGFDYPWVGGQITGTRIYSTVITFD